jgi:hypothetical protein
MKYSNTLFIRFEAIAYRKLRELGFVKVVTHASMHRLYFVRLQLMPTDTMTNATNSSSPCKCRRPSQRALFDPKRKMSALVCPLPKLSKTFSITFPGHDRVAHAVFNHEKLLHDIPKDDLVDVRQRFRTRSSGIY